MKKVHREYKFIIILTSLCIHFNTCSFKFSGNQAEVKYPPQY